MLPSIGDDVEARFRYIHKLGETSLRVVAYGDNRIVAAFHRINHPLVPHLRQLAIEILCQEIVNLVRSGIMTAHDATVQERASRSKVDTHQMMFLAIAIEAYLFPEMALHLAILHNLDVLVIRQCLGILRYDQDKLILLTNLIQFSEQFGSESLLPSQFSDDEASIDSVFHKNKSSIYRNHLRLPNTYFLTYLLVSSKSANKTHANIITILKKK